MQRLPIEDPDPTLPFDDLPPLEPATAGPTTSPDQPARKLRRSAYGYAALIVGIGVTAFIVVTNPGIATPERLAIDATPPVILVDGVPLEETVQPAEYIAPPAEPVADAPAATPEVRQPSRRVASVVRRECMAQIESANLFRGIARGSPSTDDFARAIAAESDRFLSAGTIDQRTLAQLADQAWTNRAKADQESLWWTRQYQRCEARRITGANYVVRSD